MRFICGPCNDLRFGELAADVFGPTISAHMALHRRAGDDVVSRMLSPSSFVIVRRGTPDGYLQVGDVKYTIEIDFDQPTRLLG